MSSISASPSFSVSTAPPSDFRTQLLSALHRRDHYERDHYESLISNYTILLDQLKVSKARIFQLEQESVQLRQSSSVSYSANSSIPVKSLEEKISKLQEDLTNSYRSHSEMASINLRLKEQAEKDEKALVLAKNAYELKVREFDQYKQEKDKEIENLNQRVRNGETTVEILRTEIQGNRTALSALEGKLKSFEYENNTLLEQLLKTKDEQAKELNQMNDIVQNTRKSVKEEKSPGNINVELDLTDTNNIIDHVAWQANFNVAIPTERKRTVRAHRGQCTSVRYNHNGTLIASGGTDGIIRVFDARGAGNRASLRSSNDSIMCVTFSADENYLLATGNDQSARVWSMKQRKVLHALIGHSSKIYAGTFTLDSENAITGSHDRTIRIWDLQRDGTCSQTILCHSSCNSLALSNHENYLASAHLDSHLRFWSVKTGELMHDAENVHTQQATAVEFSRDGLLAVSTSRDNTVKVLDLRTWKVLKTMENTGKEVYRNLVNWNRAVFSPDGQYICAGSATGNLFIWNSDTGKAVATIGLTGAASTAASSASSSTEVNEYSISSVDWNRNGRQIIASDCGGNLIFYEP
jgi:autophagy-related protein 16